jgi:Uma2 family endonuclease
MGLAGIFAPDERVELLAGEIFVMSLTGRFHEVLRTELAVQWARVVSRTTKLVSEMQLRLTDNH